MRVRRSASGTSVLAPAKLNLFLEVHARRADGFHEIESLMVPVAWYDRVVAVAEPSTKIRFECRLSRTLAPSTVPLGDDNLCVRAARLLRQRAGLSAGLRLTLEKRIPAESGLGGGSSDAAATLLAVNDAWRLGWDRARLMPLAAELGSDVPFFLLAGAAIARGRGEQLEPVAGLGHLSFVVMRPPEGLSTADVYRACRPSTAPRGVGPLIDALRRRRFEQLPYELHNALEPAAAAVSPCVQRVHDALADVGLRAVRMSGSGSAVFAICRHRREARRAAECLSSRGLGLVKAVDICN